MSARESTSFRPGIRFDRNELAGAFGDIGTDIPLITGMILVSGLNSASVLTVFGLLQILSGLAYRIPMPIQPLKAVAALVIAQRLPAHLVFGGGLAIGLIMLPLAAFGLLDRLAKIIPKSVVRGIQFGLGLTLCRLALGNYVLAEGVSGYVVAGASAIITLWLLGHRKYPPALAVILLGLIYAFVFKSDALRSLSSFAPALPQSHIPLPRDVLQGFLLLALPQIPLSLGNSIFATEQMARDLFPERKITFRKIGLTYSIMNLIAPFLSGIPVCHGSGGMAGHYAFGARTGGSVIIYGAALILAGLCFSQGFDGLIHAFPLPVLGVILFFEGLMLMRFLRDTALTEGDLAVALLVGALAAFLPYGFLIGMITGTLVTFLSKKYLIGFSGKLLP
jgi:MFS superfamily sulfate permease-like transporter